MAAMASTPASMADVEAAVNNVNQSMIGNIAVISTRVDNIEGRVAELIRRFEEQGNASSVTKHALGSGARARHCRRRSAQLIP